MKICWETPNLVEIGQNNSGTWHEDRSRFYICRRHEFSTQALLCNTEYLYTVDSDVYLNNRHRTHCCLLCNQPDALIIQIYSVIKLYMFRAFSLPTIRSFSTVHSALVSFMQVSDDRFQSESGWNCFHAIGASAWLLKKKSIYDAHYMKVKYYCVSTATIVTRKHHNVKLFFYVFLTVHHSINLF
jgi:hypothetical protein